MRSRTFGRKSAPVVRGLVLAVTTTAALSGVAVSASPASAAPGAVVTDAGCTTSNLPANDDSSSAPVTLPFSINFFGTMRSSAYINNNGNITFGTPLSSFTPFAVTATTPPILAAFLADVDTTGPGSGLTRWGTTTFDGRPAFCVNWRDVGYYSRGVDKTNDFQLLLIDRSDVGAAGDFDLIYNYDRVTWETGSASGGSGGLGGTSAGVGFSNGDGDAGHFYDKPGSRTPGTFLDSNSTQGLANTTTNSSVTGRHVYKFRNGRAIGITPPDTTVVSGPTGLTTNPTPTFTYTADPATGTTFACQLTPGAQAAGTFSACSSSGYPVSTALADGQYTFAVQATDDSGLTDPTPATRTFTVDTTAPSAPTITGTTGTTGSASAAFTYTSPDADIASYECAIDPAAPGSSTAFTACPTSGTSYSGLPDGAYTFRVRAVDNAGNTGPATSQTFTVDTTAPDAVLVVGPSGPTNNNVPSYTWDTAADVDHYECTFAPAADPAAALPVTCTSPTTYPSLTDGDYVFTIRAVDAVGNVGNITTRTISVDTAAPDGTITRGATGTIAGRDVAFTYATTDTDPGTTFECQLIGPDGHSGGFAPCPATGIDYTGLADGSYTFQVRSVDAAGNRSAAQTQTFQVNVGRPTVKIYLSSAKPASATGWYHTRVTINYVCDGAGSPLDAPCPPVHITKKRGVKRIVTATVRTVDGDTAQTQVPLKIDRFAPQVHATHFNRRHTYSAVPEVGCRAHDPRSGVAKCRVRAKISDNGQSVVVRLKAMDRAGNVIKRTLRAPYARPRA